MLMKKIARWIKIYIWGRLVAKNHVKNIFNKVFSAAAVWRQPRHSPLKRRTTTGVETTFFSFLCFFKLDLDSTYISWTFLRWGRVNVQRLRSLLWDSSATGKASGDGASKGCESGKLLTKTVLRQERGIGAVMLATHSSTLCWSWRSTRRRWSTGPTTSTRATGKTTRRTTMKKNATADAPTRLVFFHPSESGRRRPFLPSRPESCKDFPPVLGGTARLGCV